MDMPATPYLGKYLRDRYEDLDAEKAAGLEVRFKKILEKRADWWNPASWFSSAQPVQAPAAPATPAPTAAKPEAYKPRDAGGIGAWLGDILGQKVLPKKGTP